MGMTIGEKKSVVAEMNVVPLIDILLVLIIIFMVISPTLSRGFSASIPETPRSPEVLRPPVTTIVVQVMANGKVMINEEETSWDRLGPRVSEIFKLRAEKVAFVKGDSSVDFSEVARAIDILRASGVDMVGLVTDSISPA